MEIRNWNEMIGKKGIRIEIEVFFRMEITLVHTARISLALFIDWECEFYEF